MELSDIILQVMTEANKALKAGELVELTGKSRAEIDKALNKLKKEDRISTPKVCFWEPKK